MSTRLIIGDCRDVLPTLAAGSVQCVVTSPPYFGLRDYGTGEWAGGDPACDHTDRAYGKGRGDGKWFDGGKPRELAEGRPSLGRSCPRCGAQRIDSQIGLEATPAEYVAEIVAVFREVWRVLRDDGTCWLNLGDSYSNDTKWGGSTSGKHVTAMHGDTGIGRTKKTTGMKPKDLMGMPWRVALALQADGWYLRRDIIWAKPNPMPESVTDRPTTAHEYVFLLTKRAKYFYDAEAVREDAAPETATRYAAGYKVFGRGQFEASPTDKREAKSIPAEKLAHIAGRNLRSVWTITTAPFAEAHFATFPPKLAETCILAGTSERGACPQCGAAWARVTERTTVTPVDYEGKYLAADKQSSGRRATANVRARRMAGQGHHDNPFPTPKTIGWRQTCHCPPADPVPCVVLDPFSGAGTVGLVADRLQRNAIQIELNADYAAMTEQRIVRDAGLFAEVAS
jgi:DNA modification methylase